MKKVISHGNYTFPAFKHCFYSTELLLPFPRSSPVRKQLPMPGQKRRLSNDVVARLNQLLLLQEQLTKREERHQWEVEPAEAGKGQLTPI